ncbi:dynamin-like GTPase family protein [Massilia terrae]|uniref:Dynamin family protein n=1 Tax=Massilia terrae TaxID=1811224 RepID=A0ABT2CXX9_9BURK|nr:dynamin family protein [Massilia terrae]MCS0658660.1 dynamin family protein [Massilia terrae]
MDHDFQHYGAWRTRVNDALKAYRAALQEADLLDAASEQQLTRALNRLADDRLSIAFVAEFSRGKSELINSIFFSDYGQRILPSAAGRTTMCPTELMYDAAFVPSVRLLPIETRAQHLSTSDFRDDPNAWTVFPLDLSDPGRMHETFSQVSKTRRVPVAKAQEYGLYDPEDPAVAASPEEDGMIEIPMWRHAIINFPHPLLKQGLVILDTPGLNAIGTEPELTLNLIPNAHAVLFILGAETGVTKSDIDVWRNHIGAGSGRIVVLNKIDTIWDELKSDAANNADIKRQQASVARDLGVDENKVFPVSAKKALVARINNDQTLLGKSRIPALEAALYGELIPERASIIRNQLSGELEVLATARQTGTDSRRSRLNEQLDELLSLRGKNQGVVSHMVSRIEHEKREFDSSVQKLQGTRAVFSTLSAELQTTIGMEMVHVQIEDVRASMEAVRFGTGVRAPVRAFFDQARDNLNQANIKVGEIAAMMDTMYKRFADEHGLALAPPMTLSLDRYLAEIDRIEGIYLKQFGTATLLITSRGALLQRFFDSIASRVRRTFRAVNADVEAWLKVIMAPIEAQIRQHKDQLKHRQGSIQRIHDATDTLEQKIRAFETLRNEVDALDAALAKIAGRVTAALEADPASV